MTKASEIEARLGEAGYPVKRVSKRRWRLRVETGVIKLFIEVVVGPTLLWVRTVGYLKIPSSRGNDKGLIDLILKTDGGLARFRPVLTATGRLRGVEVTACTPHQDLTKSQVQALVESVIESAVWQAPNFQALTHGLPVPPAWPRGEDPSVGLLWSKDPM